MPMPFAAMVAMASTGVGAVGGGLAFNAATWNAAAEDFRPKLWGWDIRPLIIIGGAIAPFLFGPIIGGLAFGLGASALVSFDTSTRTKEAVDQFLTRQTLDSPLEHPLLTEGETPGWLESALERMTAEAAM